MNKSASARARKSASNKSRYHARRNAGRCVVCVVKVDTGHARCQGCRDKQAKEFRDAFWGLRRSYKPAKMTIITSMNRD